MTYIGHLCSKKKCDGNFFLRLSVDIFFCFDKKKITEQQQQKV